jgi:hypothetical protein
MDEEGGYMTGYLFPDDDLAKLGNLQLLALVDRNIDNALDMTDGSDFGSDIRIDVAQDRIEQVRDLLLGRGHVFSADDQERLSFLQWPLTDGQKAERAIAEAEESVVRAAAATRFKAYCAAMEAFVRGMVCGVAVEPPAPDWYVTIGDCRANARDGLSGASVLAMVAEVEALVGARPRLSYGCSRVGVTFETDPAPAWAIDVPLNADATVWELLKRWMATLPLSTYAEAWDMRTEAADPWYARPHVSVGHFFSRKVDVLGDPLEFVFKMDSVASTPLIHNTDSPPQTNGSSAARESETTRTYALGRLVSPEEPAYLAAMEIYASCVPRHCRTNSNEIGHWVARGGRVGSNVETFSYALLVDDQVVGFGQWASFHERSIGFLDYIAIAPAHRSPAVLTNFIALLTRATEDAGVHVVLTEVVADPVLERFCRMSGFARVPSPYFQPAMGSLRSAPGALMVKGCGGEVSRIGYLSWVSAIYEDYYRAWHRPFQSSLEAAQYAHELKELFQRVAEAWEGRTAGAEEVAAVMEPNLDAAVVAPGGHSTARKAFAESRIAYAVVALVGIACAILLVLYVRGVL